MRKQPHKGHATGQFSQYVGFGQSRGLPVENCQFRAIICYIPPTRDSNRPGEIRGWLHPIGRLRSLTGPRGRIRPGGGSHEGAPIRPDRGGVAVCRRRPRPSDHARACVRVGQLDLRVRSTLTRRHARAGGSTRVGTWVRERHAYLRASVPALLGLQQGCRTGLAGASNGTGHWPKG